MATGDDGLCPDTQDDLRTNGEYSGSGQANHGANVEDDTDLTGETDDTTCYHQAETTECKIVNGPMRVTQKDNDTDGEDTTGGNACKQDNDFTEAGSEGSGECDIEDHNQRSVTEGQKGRQFFSDRVSNNGDVSMAMDSVEADKPNYMTRRQTRRRSSSLPGFYRAMTSPNASPGDRFRSPASLKQFGHRSWTPAPSDHSAATSSDSRDPAPTPWRKSAREQRECPTARLLNEEESPGLRIKKVMRCSPWNRFAPKRAQLCSPPSSLGTGTGILDRSPEFQAPDEMRSNVASPDLVRSQCGDQCTESMMPTSSLKSPTAASEAPVRIGDGSPNMGHARSRDHDDPSYIPMHPPVHSNNANMDPKDEIRASLMHLLRNQRVLADRRNALRRQAQIDSGEYAYYSMDERKRAIYERTSGYQSRNRKMLLEMEIKVLECNMEIKKSMVVGNLQPDVCASHLETLRSLTVTPFMLRKYPDILYTVDTLRRIEGYEDVKAKAQKCYHHFMALTQVPHNSTFIRAFNADMVAYKKETYTTKLKGKTLFETCTQTRYDPEAPDRVDVDTETPYVNMPWDPTRPVMVEPELYYSDEGMMYESESESESESEYDSESGDYDTEDSSGYSEADGMDEDFVLSQENQEQQVVDPRIVSIESALMEVRELLALPEVMLNPGLEEGDEAQALPEDSEQDEGVDLDNTSDSFLLHDYDDCDHWAAQIEHHVHGDNFGKPTEQVTEATHSAAIEVTDGKDEVSNSGCINKQLENSETPTHGPESSVTQDIVTVPSPKRAHSHVPETKQKKNQRQRTLDQLANSNKILAQSANSKKTLDQPVISKSNSVVKPAESKHDEDRGHQIHCDLSNEGHVHATRSRRKVHWQENYSDNIKEVPEVESFQAPIRRTSKQSLKPQSDLARHGNAITAGEPVADNVQDQVIKMEYFPEVKTSGRKYLHPKPSVGLRIKIAMNPALRRLTHPNLPTYVPPKPGANAALATADMFQDDDGANKIKSNSKPCKNRKKKMSPQTVETTQCSQDAYHRGAFSMDTQIKDEITEKTSHQNETMHQLKSRKRRKSKRNKGTPQHPCLTTTDELDERGQHAASHTTKPVKPRAHVKGHQSSRTTKSQALKLVQGHQSRLSGRSPLARLGVLDKEIKKELIDVGEDIDVASRVTRSKARGQCDSPAHDAAITNDGSTNMADISMKATGHNQAVGTQHNTRRRGRSCSGTAHARRRGRSHRAAQEVHSKTEKQPHNLENVNLQKGILAPSQKSHAKTSSANARSRKRTSKSCEPSQRWTSPRLRNKLGDGRSPEQPVVIKPEPMDDGATSALVCGRTTRSSTRSSRPPVSDMKVNDTVIPPETIKQEVLSDTCSPVQATRTKLLASNTQTDGSEIPPTLVTTRAATDHLNHMENGENGANTSSVDTSVSRRSRGKPSQVVRISDDQIQDESEDVTSGPALCNPQESSCGMKPRTQTDLCPAADLLMDKVIKQEILSTQGSPAFSTRSKLSQLSQKETPSDAHRHVDCLSQEDTPSDAHRYVDCLSRGDTPSDAHRHVDGQDVQHNMETVPGSTDLPPHSVSPAFFTRSRLAQLCGEQ